MADNPKILRASYEGVPFPVSGAKTKISHDGAEHKALLVPGSDWEPTGANSDEGSLTIPFVDGVEGLAWPSGWERLISVVRSTPIGRLVHPSRGELRVFVQMLEEVLDPEVRNGTMATLQWSVHNPEAQRAVSATDASATNAEAQAERADAALLAVGVTSTLNADTAAALDALSALTALSAATVSATFSDLIARAEVHRANRVVLTARGFAAYRELTALIRAFAAAREAYLPTTTSATFTVRAPTSVLDVAAEVYGDATLASRILRANALTDPMALSPGTVLVIPAGD